MAAKGIQEMEWRGSKEIMEGESEENREGGTQRYDMLMKGGLECYSPSPSTMSSTSSLSQAGHTQRNNQCP
jgi:hypothetical protein